MPCAHALKYFQQVGYGATNYIDRQYSVAEYVDTYSGQLQPLGAEYYWPLEPFKMVCNKDYLRKLQGKKRMRIRNQMDVGDTVYAHSSGSLKLLDMPSSPAIEEYQTTGLYALVKTVNGTSRQRQLMIQPVVIVDGTFLKSAYRGIILTASTMDAADRNESILKATSIVYPGMTHYSCMWHIWTNIRSKFKKGHLQLYELYFATARSYTLDEFNERMSKIEEVDPRVKSYLYDIGYHKWSRVHATMNRTWTMTLNIAESLNAATKDARELPIFDLLEYIRTLLERWTNEKLLKAKGTFTFLGSKFNKELENNRTLSEKLRVRASTDHIHTVLDGVKWYIVCLEKKKYSCDQFQLEELPCAHALAALRHKNETYENYCSPHYTRESLLHTYEIPINPLPDESKWNVPQHILDEVVNPLTGDKKQSGRPQKERYKTYDEIKSKKYKVSCGNCGGEGHNKRSCKNAPKKK
ncbi:uncharacterized protein LOC107774503 [Nicotiana tabacum]|uniref:Uncharacterized protein LOC107774503 n=1 Tax=Nicotiana tabacum TaxID=4097 RepID=A0AC58URS5_TOBAC